MTKSSKGTAKQRAEPSLMHGAPYIALLAIAYVLLNVPLFGTKPDNFDAIKVFSVDEHQICVGVASVLRMGSFIQPGSDPESPSSGCNPYPYGQLYPILVAAPLMALSAVIDVNEFMIVRWALIVMVLAGVIILLATYATAARLYSPWYGLLAALLVLITPEFLRWSNEIHPDLPQLAALITGFYFTVRLYEVAPIDARRRKIYAALAAACAGLAMAAKFNGFFLLPAIYVAYNRDVLSADETDWRDVAVRNVTYGLGCLAVFLGVTILCNPCFVANPDLALEPFTRSAENTMIAVRVPLSLWERILAFIHSNRVMAEAVVGYGTYVLFLGALVLMPWQLWSRSTEELRSPRILAEIYIVPFLIYSLVLGYGLTDGRLLTGYGRYLLPALPMICISALRVIQAVAQTSGSYRGAAMAAVGLILCAGQAPLLAGFIEQYRAFHARKEMGFFQVYDWVMKNIPKGARIYTEAYIYVPLDEYRVTRHYAVASPEQMAVSDYVITKTLDYEVYKKPDRWYLYSKEPHMVYSKQIYELLAQERLPEFQRVALLSAGDAFERSDAVAVYKNLNPKPVPPEQLMQAPSRGGDQITGGVYAGQIQRSQKNGETSQ